MRRFALLNSFLAVAAAILLGFPAAAEPLDEQARLAWGFDRSRLVPHPEVRFGVLANGMRFALMRSAVPAGSLAARLHVDSGASAEGRRERGFMHLIEHLVFEGSANLPQGALQLMLSSRGLRRWSDFDAFTDFTETVYRIDLGQSDSGARETVLTVFDEVLRHLRFDRRTVAGAKRAVAAEIRARDRLKDRILAEQSALFVPGTAVESWHVAGTAAGIGRATPAALRRLHALHYVPPRTTLIMVGDFDPAVAAREIAERFSGWAAGPGAARATLPAVEHGSSRARLLVDRDARTTVTVAAAGPVARAADAAEKRDSAYLQHLAAEMLSRRLAPLGIEAAIYDHFEAARIASLELTATDRDWGRALATVARELKRALGDGFTPAELAEQLQSSRGALARSAAPRTSKALADAILDSVSRDYVFTEPGDAAASAAYLATIRLDEMNAAFRAAWADPARLVFVTHHRPIPGGEGAILAAWAATR